MKATINETRTVVTYFRGSARFGRTTTLVHKTTGEKLFEVMGVATRQQAYKAYAK